MNRHKSNWSAMGIDERTESSIYEEIRKKDKETLKTMIQISGFDEIVTLLREIHEEHFIIK